MVVLVIVVMCSHDECQFEKDHFGKDSPEYRACRANARSGSSYGSGYGGSYGGWSSGGGGHK